MIENILKSVTETEAQADAIVKEAEQQAASIVEEAKQQAQALKEAKAYEIKSKNQDMLKHMQMMSEENVVQAADAAKKEVDDLRHAVEAKRKDAIEAVLTLVI